MLVDHELSGRARRADAGTRPEDIYRALIEATAFGTRMIVETLPRASGVPVEELIVAGGLLKNPLRHADLRRRHPPAAVVIELRAGPGARLGDPRRRRGRRFTRTSPRPSAAMGKVRRDAYLPDEERADAYDELFAHYLDLHDHFGRGDA